MGSGVDWQQQAAFLLNSVGLQGVVAEGLEVGGINDVVIFTDNQGKKILRCRTREFLFGYEKEFMKEPLVARFLVGARSFDPHYNDPFLNAVVQSSLSELKGGSFYVRPLPNILSYDYTKKEAPFLWMIQECVSGYLLHGMAQAQQWYEIGYKIGWLHRMELSRSGLFDNLSRTAEERIQDVVAEIHSKSPVPLTRTFDLRSLAQGSLAICHNDLHGRNIIATNGSSIIIDWDNASVDFPELDLVKPRYWISSDANGFFAPDEAFYQEYRRGHAETFDRPINAERLELYELLWLCRVYQFEKAREASGRAVMPPSPPASSYLERMQMLAQGA